MLVNEKDAVARLESSDNLINKLRTLSTKKPSSMGLFGLGAGKPFIPSSLQTNSLSSTTTAIERKPFDPFAHSKQATEIIPSSPQQVAPSTLNTTLAPRVGDILEDVDIQIKLATAHNDALDVLTKAVAMMGTKLDDIKPDKLPSVISAATKTVESIRKEKLELGKNRKEKNVHFHFYEPERKQLNDYTVIDV